MPKYQHLLSLISLSVATLFMMGCDLESSSSNSGTDGVSSVDGQNLSPGNGTDELSLKDVVWLDTDISGWPITTQLNASVSGGTMQLPYDKARVWPTASTRASNGGPLNANAWIVVNVDGTWYAATWEWLRTGQTSKPISAVTGGGGHIPRPPLNTFRPRSGETYGFIVSTPARTSDRTINERSNVSLVVWP
jgi:hypothetical protein